MTTEPEHTYTPSEVKLIEMLASIQTTQKFILDRLDTINGTIGRHDQELREHSVALEVFRHELATLTAAVGRHADLLDSHEAVLQQSRGIWRVVIAISSVVSLIVTAVSILLANRLVPGVR
jgi:hypothetical protein